MSERDRGLTLEQAAIIAGDPATAPSVLSRLANGYPEIWPVLLANPATPPELKEWLEKALRPQPVATPTVQSRGNQSVSSTDETGSFEPIRRTPDGTTAPNSPSRDRRTSSPPIPPSPRVKRIRRRSRSRGLVLTVVVSLLFISATGAVSAWSIGQTPAPGLIVTQEIATTPGISDSWSYDLVQGQKNPECIEWTFKSLSQDIVIVLSQYASANDGCDDLEERPETYLASVNTRTGVENWRVNVAEKLSWTEDWKKSLMSFTGLNEIIVRFTDTSDETDEDPPQSLVPFNRLDGSITDAVIAKSSSDPTLTAPHLEVGRIPWSNRNVVVGFPADDEERRLTLRRAKNLTEDKWSVTTELEPIHGNPVLGASVILGAEYDDKPQAVELETGEVSDWSGPAGGKILNVDGSYIHVHGDGTKERVTNEESQDGTAETSDCDSECITLTGVTVDGLTVWEKNVPGYAVARDTNIMTNADSGQFGSLFVVDPDRNSATRIDPVTGDAVWESDQSWGDFEIGKISGADVFFTYETPEGADNADRVEIRRLSSGEIIKDYGIENDQTRIDGVSTRFAYLVDEPDRQKAVDDIEAGESSGDDSGDDEDPASQERVCITALNLLSGTAAWEWSCNGYQHVLLAAGNWVVFDKTPGEQSMKGLREKP